MNYPSNAQALIQARAHLLEKLDPTRRFPRRPEAEEGGCGVTGFACNIPVSGRHIFEPSVQMHNRGNGKGGGIAAVGLEAAKLGVDQDTLDGGFPPIRSPCWIRPYCPNWRRQFIRPCFRVDHEAFLPTVDDYRDVPGLEVEPPTVKRYFVRVRPEVLARFQKERRLDKLLARKVEEEFIYQNSFRLNQTLLQFPRGEKRAFVLSHGRNMMILKIVGYAEQVAQYYRSGRFQGPCLDRPSALSHQRTGLAPGRGPSLYRAGRSPGS